MIFEEAAGISQFKIKSCGARADGAGEQNPLRLSDIVDEVKAACEACASGGKACRYREATERLRQLRTEVALVDWRALTKAAHEPRVATCASCESAIRRTQHAISRRRSGGAEIERASRPSAQQIRELEAGSKTREQMRRDRPRSTISSAGLNWSEEAAASASSWPG